MIEAFEQYRSSLDDVERSQAVVPNVISFLTSWDRPYMKRVDLVSRTRCTPKKPSFDEVTPAENEDRGINY